MKRAIVLILWFLGSTALFAQDLRAEFTAMNDHLMELRNYRMSVNYRAGSQADEFDKGLVSVFVGTQGMFYSMKEMSIMMNAEKMIVVDDHERSIIYSDNRKVNKKESMFLTDYLLQGIDSLMFHADSIYFFEENDQRVYNVRKEGGYFNLVQLKFADELLSEVVYHYNSDFVEDEGMTSVCKVQLEENISFDEKFLTTEFYMIERDGMMVPSENFDNYLILYNEALESFMD